MKWPLPITTTVTLSWLAPIHSSPKTKDRYKYLYLDKTEVRSNSNLDVLNINMLFDVNFIRKERVYTKLKYSRSPAYDIVSGGAAALLSGFIGFLVSEKFGIELVDSGDFYTGFMYMVFLTLSCRPLLRSISTSSSAGLSNPDWTFFSMSYLLSYLKVLFCLILYLIKPTLNIIVGYYLYILTFEGINCLLLNLLLLSIGL